MCGRFTLRAPAKVVAEQFCLFEVEPFTPRFNIAPTQPVAVVRCPVARKEQPSHLMGATGADRPVDPAAGPPAPPDRELVWLRWGLLPRWATESNIASRLINARAESVMDKPAYRGAFQRRRCLMVADGFYEWQKVGSGKQPYFIHMRDDRPFAFAAIWEAWENAGEGRIESAALLTTESNALIAPIHNRMPVILDPKHYAYWLDVSIRDPEGLLALLRPYPPEKMAAYPVSSYVNNPAHDDPRCIQRAAG